MSESQLHDRVQEVLNVADAASGSIVAGSDSDGENGSVETDLLEAAAEANDLLESADPDELLAAVGLDTLADGSEPDSIPAAIARGEQENVEDLQRLLRLSKLAHRADDGSLEGAVDDLRKAISERAESTAEDEKRDAGGSGREDESAADEAESETGEVDEGDSEATESDEGESGATDDIGDRLRSAMSDSFADFGDEVSQLKERLEAASAGQADSDTAAVTDADESTDETETAETDETETEDEVAAEEAGAAADAAGDEEDDPDDEESDGRDRKTTSGGSSRHSTMAPPPSQRADMRKTTRHSTMPDKYG